MGIGCTPAGSQVFWTLTDWWCGFIFMHNNHLVCPYGHCEGLLASLAMCAVLRNVRAANLGILIILLWRIFAMMILEKC